MTRLTMIEFEKLSIADKITYALAIGMNYYRFYRKRPALVGWRYLEKIAYCPLCKMETELVSVGFMNHVYWNRVIDHPRCEQCLLKLPVVDKKIKALLNIEEPKKLPHGQTVLL